MYMRMKREGSKKWEKMDVNFLDFFVFNFVAGAVLGGIMGVIIATITVFI